MKTIYSTQTFAELIDKCEYRNELTPEQIQLAKDNGLVVVFGASDDLVELEGAISEEFGTDVLIDKEGEQIEYCDDECAHYKKAIKNANKITGHYTRNGWIFETEIPHHTFKVMEDGELYGIGIVFSKSNLK